MKGRSTPLLIAGMLFAAGMVFLIWPVSSSVPHDGQVRGAPSSASCGMTIAQALRTPKATDDPGRARTVDCAARARDRLGYALLFLLLAVPPAVLAIDDSARRGRTN